MSFNLHKNPLKGHDLAPFPNERTKTRRGEGLCWGCAARQASDAGLLSCFLVWHLAHFQFFAYYRLHCCAQPGYFPSSYFLRVCPQRGITKSKCVKFLLPDGSWERGNQFTGHEQLCSCLPTSSPGRCLTNFVYSVFLLCHILSPLNDSLPNDSWLFAELRHHSQRIKIWLLWLHLKECASGRTTFLKMLARALDSGCLVGESHEPPKVTALLGIAVPRFVNSVINHCVILHMRSFDHDSDPFPL